MNFSRIFFEFWQIEIELNRDDSSGNHNGAANESSDGIENVSLMEDHKYHRTDK
jgi:hypothetical protein